MKVVQVVPSLAPRSGGPAIAALDTALALGRVGLSCVTVSTDLATSASSQHRTRLSSDAVRVVGRGTQIKIARVRFPTRLAFAPAMWGVLRDECRDADVVHIYSLFLFPQFVAWATARRLGLPYVVAPCGALDPFLRPRSRRIKAVNDALWQRRMLDGASFVHYTTVDERNLASDLGIRAPTAVVPHPFDFDAFASADGSAFRRKHMRDPAAPLVMNIGRISHKKGLDRLLAAFPTVLETCPNAELAIVGPDDEGLEQGLRAQAAELRIADRVIFTGLVTGADLYGATAAADCWALPSHTENLALAVLEALAAGRAAVITPAINIALDLQRHGGAIVVPADDPVVFGREIARVLEDPVLRRELGAKGREFAKGFSHRAVAPRLREMYELAVHERRR